MARGSMRDARARRFVEGAAQILRVLAAEGRHHTIIVTAVDQRVDLQVENRVVPERADPHLYSRSRVAGDVACILGEGSTLEADRK